MPGLYAPYKIYTPGEVLTAGDLNATDQNHIINQTVQATDDYQLDASQKRIQTNPASGLATSLAGDIEQIRWVLAKLGRTSFWDEITAPPSVALSGYKFGLGCENDAGDPDNDIFIRPGVARSDDNTADMTLVSGLVKRLDAVWAVGTNQGMLESGVKTPNTWYFLHLIERIDTEVVDVIASTSSSAPTLPANYTKKRLIFAVRTLADGKIKLFKLYKEDWVMWVDPHLGTDVTNLSTARSLYDVLTPTGFRTEVLANVLINASGKAMVYICSPEATDQAPSLTVSPLASIDMSAGNEPSIAQMTLRCDTTQKIAARSDRTNTTLRVAELGWKAVW